VKRPGSDEPTKVRGPDGLIRDRRTEQQINGEFHALFGTDLGQRVLGRLKNITVHHVHAPGSIDSDALFMHEGARWLVSVIDARVMLGESQARSSTIKTEG